MGKQRETNVIEKEEYEKYIKICQARNKQYLKDWSEKKVELQQKINDVMKELFLTIRAKDDAEFQVQTFNSALEINKQKYIDEYKALKDLQSYEYINLTEVNGEVAFKGQTIPVEIEHNGKTYKMGRYEVVIQHGSVKIYQEGNTNNNIHPHISGGNPCLGDAAQSIPKFLANYEYAIVFDMIYKYLCSYNPASPYKRIEEFKEKK